MRTIHNSVHLNPMELGVEEGDEELLSQLREEEEKNVGQGGNPKGDELGTDSFIITPPKAGHEVDGVIFNEAWYTLELSTRTDKEDGQYNTGSNASQEEAEEGTDASVSSGIDVVLNHKLVENATIKTKKDLRKYIKTYYPLLKKVTTKKHEASMTADELKDRLKQTQDLFNTFVAKFDELQFFSGPSMNVDGTQLIVMWVGTTPYGYIPVDGVVLQKQ